MANAESVQSFRFPQLFPDEVAEKNMFFSGCTAVSVPLAGDQWMFVLESKIISEEWQCRIYGDWGNAEVMLFIDQPPPISLGIAGLDGLRAQKLPAELLAAVGETVLEPALDALEQASGMQISISSILVESVDADDAEEFVPFRLEHADGRIIRGALAFTGDAAAAREIFIALLKRFDEPYPAWLSTLPVSMNVELGEVRLALRELATLELQDIILLDSCPAAEDFALLRADNSDLVFKTRVEGSTLTIQERIMTMNTEDTQPDMPTEESSQNAATTSADIRGIVLPLRLELETISISVEELTQIKPGYILETTKPVDSPVSLKVNGRSIGTGELVDVAGKVGVRVLTLGKKSSEDTE